MVVAHYAVGRRLMLGSIPHAKWPSMSVNTRLYGTTYPYKKLRAFPFVLPPDEAVRRMSPYAKYSCGEFGLLDRILPEVFVEPKRPVNLEAVYMPAWLIGGSSLFNFVFDKGTLKETRGMFANYANTMYIPGCDIPLLSTANVWSSRVMKDNVPIPFSDSFLKGQIEDIENEYIKGITCFPFTISPFSVLKLIQTASGLAVKLGDIEAYIERARIHSFSAMPVLLPMYAAKHQDKDGKSFMMFIEAHTIKASVKFDKLQTFSVKVKHGIKLPPRQTLRNSSEELVIDLAKYDNGVEVFDTGYAFGRVNGLYENINSKTDHAFAEVYLWNLLGIYKNIQQLASMGSLSSDEDPRIREMTADEIASRTEAIDKWQQKLQGIALDNRAKSAKKETAKLKSKIGSWSKYTASPKPHPTLSSNKSTQKNSTATQPNLKNSGTSPKSR